MLQCKMGVHSIMMRPRSNPNTKAKIQCFSWAQVPALKSYWTSAPLAAVPTKIQNTEGIRKKGKYEICMKYVDIFSSSTSISSRYKGSKKYDNKIVRQQEE